MKKYFITKRFKKYNKKHAQKSLKARIRFKEYLKSKNKLISGLTKKKEDLLSKFSKIDPHDPDVEQIEAPAIFSLLENPIEVIKFMNQLKLLYEQGKKVNVLMDHIEKINYGAIVVLLSIMIKFTQQELYFNGTVPRNNECRTKLIKSGFFDRVYKTSNKKKLSPLSEHSINTNFNKKVESKFAYDLIKNASAKIWGTQYHCKGAYSTLIELMQNTNAHADKKSVGNKHWWLSVNFSKKEKIVGFAFIDYGIGVFESLKSKTHGSKFFGLFNFLSTKFNIKDNAEFMKIIFEGKLHDYATKLKTHRGFGLPGIYNSMKRNYLSNLHVITNNVYANAQKDEYKVLPISFEGTFVYFELNEASKKNAIKKQNKNI